MSRRALLVALLVAGCGAAATDRPLVVVDVAGARNGAATVGVTSDDVVHATVTLQAQAPRCN